MASKRASDPLHPVFLSALALLVGILSGLAAVAFHLMIGFVHNVLFEATPSFSYSSLNPTPPSPWGPLVVLVPVVGALGVAFITKTLDPNVKGSGVPEVMDAIYYKHGVIGPRLPFLKSIASALSIGSGASVGREGPMIQICAGLGSIFGQLIPMHVWQRITLITAGAAGGIAATFNAPVGGLLFSVEILLHEVSLRTMVPILLSTMTATYVGRYFLGYHLTFSLPQAANTTLHLVSLPDLCLYALLGILLGGVSALLIKSVFFVHALLEKLFGKSVYARHLFGMLLVGGLIYLFLKVFGHYYVEGTGEAAIQEILSKKDFPLYLLAVLFAGKLLAMSLALGSGAAGGIYSTALYLGATAGAAYTEILRWIFPGLALVPAEFAVVGMAGVVAGSTGAVMAGIVMIFEMTLDYNLIIPILVVAALSDGVRRILSRRTFYTVRLLRREQHAPESLQGNFFYLQSAIDIMDKHVLNVAVSGRIGEVRKRYEQSAAAPLAVVSEGEKILGVATGEAVFRALSRSGEGVWGEIAREDFITIGETTTLFDTLIRMREKGASVALVVPDPEHVSPGQVRGVVTKERIAEAVEGVVDLFSG